MTGVPYTDRVVVISEVYVGVVGVGRFPWFCAPAVVVIGEKFADVVDVCEFLLCVPGVVVVVDVIGACRFPRVLGVAIVGENVVDVIGVCGSPWPCVPIVVVVGEEIMGVVGVSWSPLRLLFPCLLVMIVVRWRFPGLVGRTTNPRLSFAVQGEPGFPQRGVSDIVVLLGKIRGAVTGACGRAA